MNTYLVTMKPGSKEDFHRTQADRIEIFTDNSVMFSKGGELSLYIHDVESITLVRKSKSKTKVTVDDESRTSKESLIK